MDLSSRLTLLGGACERTVLERACEPEEITRALENGLLLEARRSRYVLATSPLHVLQAVRVGGVLSHRSAAQHWGWAQRRVPAKPEVTVPRDVHLSAAGRRAVLPHWIDLSLDDEVDGLVTSPRRTLVDCMRNLPLLDSLPIVDSALRAGDISAAELVELADSTRGRGRERIRCVARLADARTANAFESTLHAIAVQVPGLSVVPQLAVPVPGTDVVLHPDVADGTRRIAIEAEGFEWHGESAALTRDCRRYNTLTVLGWAVIRFSWVLVIQDPAYVHTTLAQAVRRSDSQSRSTHATA